MHLKWIVFFLTFISFTHARGSNFPDFGAISRDSVLANPSSTQTGVSVGGSYHTEKDSIESSDISRTDARFSASFEHSSGLKIIVFDHTSEFRLQHVLNFNSKIKGNFTANATGSAELMDSTLEAIQSQIDQYAPGQGQITGGRASFQADAQGDVEGEISGTAVMDLAIKEMERGVHVAIPLAGSPGKSQLVFETGVKQRTDFVVLRLASANLVAKARAQASVSGNIRGEVDATASLPNAFPFPYSPPAISSTFSHEENFDESWSRSGSASVDLKDELQKAGVPTSLRSEQTYYVIPVGIGFYSRNGSKIRLLVDLKPERIMKPLRLNAPTDLQKANEALSMISAARLEAEGRVDFDSFTWLAGLNAHFRTVEVSLREATGDEQAVALPMHAGIQIYTGVETDSWGVKLIGEAKFDINRAHAGGLIEIRKSWENGMSLGVLTGYQKHIRLYGVPELSRSDTFSGSFQESSSNSYGSGQVSGNYQVSHNSILNEGQKGYETYNAIPVAAMLSAPMGDGTGIIHGRAVFTDHNDKFEVHKAGGGLGYEFAGKKSKVYVGASAYKTYPTTDQEQGSVQGGLDLGISF